MSELKRKREENGLEGEEPGTADVACVAPNASPATPSSPAAPAVAVQAAAAPAAAPPTPPASTAASTSESAAAAAAASADTAAAPNASGASAPTAEGDAGATAAGVASSASSSPPPPAKHAATTPATKILICGKEITLKETGGRKKRKHTVETLIILAYKGQLAMACKANNMVSALEIYGEMKSKGIKQDLSTHLMVLSLCGGSPGEKDELDPGNGSTGLHVAALAKAAAAAAAAAAAHGGVGNASAQENTHAAAEAALQIFSDASNGGAVSLPESAYTAVIRACCLDGRADRAREALEALKRADVRPRVRTYAPLLEAYSGLDGRLQDCMDIWRDAVLVPKDGQPRITMTEREYLHLVAACTRARDEKCFLEVMEEYMDDVLQPRSRHSWDVLKAWFKVAPNAIGNGVAEHSKPKPEAQVQEEETPEGGVRTRVGGTTDDASPTCPAADDATGEEKDSPSGGDGGGDGDGDDAMGAQKEPPSDGNGGGCSDGSWSVVECKVGKDGTCENCGEVLRSIELSQDDEQRLLKQIEVLVCTNEQRTRQWEGFRGWLERRGKDRYNVIIDGANVGYFKQSAVSQGELADLRQVDWAVKKYEEEGKKPLVVLHSRHLVEKRLSDEAKAIYKRWKEADIIQSCAPKNNDDWYWLYAAVYTGGAVLVLTNDEMRDHHLSMLSHRSFQRWKERHQTRFTFGDWIKEGSMRELVADEPRSYSKRTQRGVDSWHVPLERSGDWLCARWRR